MKVEKELERYLFEKNIYVSEEYFKWQGYREKEDIINHLKLISEFQKILFKFNTNKYSGVLCNYGKEVEKIKNGIIILRSLDVDEFKPLKSELEEKYESLKKINIKALIKRGIDRKEITIGRIDEKNLRILDEIEIGKIKKVNYNIIEEDVIDYLRKVKRIFKKEEIQAFIIAYIKFSKLSEESLKYIELMTNIPYESIRYINKLKSNLNEKKLIDLIRMECRGDNL